MKALLLALAFSAGCGGSAPSEKLNFRMQRFSAGAHHLVAGYPQ